MFAIEYEVVGHAVAVVASLDKTGRRICQLKPGNTFWGWPVRGGIIEIATYLSGYVSEKDRDGFRVIRPTTNAGKLLAEVRFTSRKIFSWIPKHYEAFCFACRSWRVQISTVIVRQSPSFDAKQVGIMRKDTIFKVSKESNDWLTVVQPISGYVARRKDGIGALVFIDAVPDVEIDLIVRRPDTGQHVSTISVRTTSTLSNIKASISAHIPIPESEINVRVRIDKDIEFDAPATSTAWDLGLKNGDTLIWSFVGKEEVLSELLDRELNVNVTIETDAIGQSQECAPMRFRADESISKLITHLCKNYPALQRTALIPIRRRSSDHAVLLDPSMTLWSAGIRDSTTMLFYYLDKIRNESTTIDHDPQERFEVNSNVEEIQTMEEMKQVGDNAFRSRDFSLAVKEYSKCLAAYPHVFAVRNNRAAANKQLREYAAVIFDTSSILEVEPANVKALLRRSEALEALEKYNDALKDIDNLLGISDRIGSDNMILCRKAQLRLRQQLASEEQLQQAQDTSTTAPKADAIGQIVAPKRNSKAARRDFEESRIITSTYSKAQHKTTLIWLSKHSEFDDVRHEANHLEKFVSFENPGLKLIVVAPPKQRCFALDQEYDSWFDLHHTDWCSLLNDSNENLLSEYACTLLKKQIEQVAMEIIRPIVDREVAVVGAKNVAIGGNDKGAVIALHSALAMDSHKALGGLIMVNGPSPLLTCVLKKIKLLQTTSVWTLRGTHCVLLPEETHDNFHSVLRHRLPSISTEVIPTGCDEIMTIDYAYIGTVVSLTVGAFKHIHAQEYAALFEKSRINVLEKRMNARKKKHSRSC